MADGIIQLDTGWRLDSGILLDQPPPPQPPSVLPVMPRPQKGIIHMDFIPTKRGDLYLWWKNIHDKIEEEGPKFGLTVAQIAAIKALAAAQMALMEATDAAADVLEGARTAEKTGKATNTATIRMMIRNWKSTPGFLGSTSEGVLRVTGPESTFDPDTFKPTLSLSIVGGQIKGDFTKGECDSVNYYCRLRGTAVWTRLGSDPRSPLWDRNPLANPNVPEVREYMIIGVIDNEEVGVPSDIVSIVFGG